MHQLILSVYHQMLVTNSRTDNGNLQHVEVFWHTSQTISNRYIACRGCGCVRFIQCDALAQFRNMYIFYCVVGVCPKASSEVLIFRLVILQQWVAGLLRGFLHTDVPKLKRPFFIELM